MKKILFIMLLAATLFAAEPLQYGAYYGDIKVKMKDYNSYPGNNASSAGNVYLFKQKKNDIDYIFESKQSHINAGLKEAKELAIKNKNRYFAIDNVNHEVIITDNQVYVLTNYNVLSFD